MIIATLLIVAFALLLSIGFAKAYSALASLHMQTGTAWGQIESLLERRNRLIPDLVDTVKHHISPEHETIQNVVQAHSAALEASTVGEKAAAEQSVSSSLTGLFHLAGEHPHLGVDHFVHSLKEELMSAEQKVAFASRYYNDLSEKYNAKLRKMPSAIVGKMGSLGPRELFVLEDPAAREA